MDKNIEQTVYLKCCVCKQISPEETLEMLEKPMNLMTHMLNEEMQKMVFHKLLIMIRDSS